ncbi:MAG TPA: RibD family protein [Candidatus Latescibacteria bacterium]|nr:RibD family protein [Candidatus Latescibacterota bacterium]
MSNRRDWPHVRLMMATTLDGKIATSRREAARFGSPEDARRLETQVAWADVLLFGAATLRAYGTTYRVRREALLRLRQRRRKPPQPVTAVVTSSLDLPLEMPFFTRQDVPRVIITAESEKDRATVQFCGLAEVIARGASAVDWNAVLAEFKTRGLKRVLLLGGGHLNAELLSLGCVDEVCVTVSPFVFGGTDAPTIADGNLAAKHWRGEPQLRTSKLVGEEVFCTYRFRKRSPVNGSVRTQ